MLMRVVMSYKKLPEPCLPSRSAAVEFIHSTTLPLTSSPLFKSR